MAGQWKCVKPWEQEAEVRTSHPLSRIWRISFCKERDSLIEWLGLCRGVFSKSWLYSSMLVDNLEGNGD